MVRWRDFNVGPDPGLSPELQKRIDSRAAEIPHRPGSRGWRHFRQPCEGNTLGNLAVASTLEDRSEGATFQDSDPAGKCGDLSPDAGDRSNTALHPAPSPQFRHGFPDTCVWGTPIALLPRLLRRGRAYHTVPAALASGPRTGGCEPSRRFQIEEDGLIRHFRGSDRHRGKLRMDQPCREAGSGNRPAR